MTLRLAALLVLPAITAGPMALPDPRVSVGPETGRIVGTVEISRALASRRPQFRIYSDPTGVAAPSAPRDDLASEMRNVVVYLDGAAAARPDSQMVGVMSQADERFDPHVIAVVEGSRVEFPNRDKVYHNVFSLSSARTFDLGRYPKGSTKSVTFGKRGVVQVFCHIHADMSGIVLVLPNAHFASPSESGRYELADVPPGEYSIVGWHERTPPVTRRIRVVAGQTVTVDFSLPLGAGPDQ